MQTYKYKHVIKTSKRQLTNEFDLKGNQYIGRYIYNLQVNKDNGNINERKLVIASRGVGPTRDAVLHASQAVAGLGGVIEGHDVCSVAQSSATSRTGLLVQQLMEHGLCPGRCQRCSLLYHLCHSDPALCFCPPCIDTLL